MALIPPRIFDLGGNAAALGNRDAFSLAATLGFSHVLVPPEDATAAVADAAAHRIAALVDIDLFERDAAEPWVQDHPELFAVRENGHSRVVDPRRPAAMDGRAIARVYESPDLFLGWWREQLETLVQCGVQGFRFRHPDRLGGEGWRELLSDLRKSAPEAIFIADTVGLGRDQLKKLEGCGFDHCLSSLAWWDFRSSWLVEEYEALLAVGRPLASLGAPDRLPPAARQARCGLLALGALTAMGVVVPANFAESETDFDEGPDLEEGLRTANRIVASNPIVQANGTLFRATGAGARCTVLVRTDNIDARVSSRALLAIVNPDPNASFRVAEMCAPVEDWDLARGALLIGSSADNLGPGEARLFEVARRKAIRAAAKVTARGAEAAAKEPRIVIAGVSPAVDDGRFAAKRIVGDTVVVEADLITDGHPVLAAELCFRGDDEKAWQRTPMVPLGNDRFRGTFVADRVGRHRFAIEAWIDEYGAFVRDLKKKAEARRDIALDLEEGRGRIEENLRSSAGGSEAAVADIAVKFEALDTDRKLATLTAPDTIEAMRRLDKRSFLTRSSEYCVEADRIGARFASWYELFPRSQTTDASRHGTFDDVIARLPAVAAMGFDVLYLPPIHPIGVTNRKGRNNSLQAAPGDPGSVYAIGSAQGGHDAIHPQLGTMSDFLRLVAAARSHRLEIALDFAVQCSPDHPWLKEHPGWFDWRADGSVKYAENPPKVYEDIVNVDFYGPDAVPGLWLALRDVVLFWAKAGVRIFRVDNPHTKPFAFWRWMIASVRAANPDIIFLSEAFTRPKVMYHLARLGFTQSYTYFTWRNGKDELTAYLRELTSPPVADFFRPNFFVNTPDINPYFLQTSGRAGFLIRAALAATLSGSWGVYSGFELCEAAPLPGREEYLDSEKYEVKPRDWNAPGNIVAEITQLNRLRRTEPALQTHLGLTFYNAFNPNILYFGKHAPGDGSRILVAVSLNPHGAEDADFEIPLWEWGLPDSGRLAVEDLLSGARFIWQGKVQHVRLTPDAPYRIWRAAPAPEA